RYGETDDLCPGTRTRVLRHAGRSKCFERSGKGQLPLPVHHSGNRAEHAFPDANEIKRTQRGEDHRTDSTKGVAHDHYEKAPAPPHVPAWRIGYDGGTAFSRRHDTGAL